MIRVEVQVRKGDADLLRGVAKALTDPAREAETRALSREPFGAADAFGLKALLAAAPLDGIDLTRAVWGGMSSCALLDRHPHYF